MNRLLTAFLAIVAFSPVACLADTPVPSGHSTVHILFISSHSQPMTGGLSGDPKPMARIGDAIVPTDSIRPIRITIDGDFVGHAMVGMWDIKPVFVLPEGHRKFTFAIDGFDPIPADITVLGTGSKQYLIVRLPSEKPQP
jgi:hypothetical protein